MVIFYSYLKLPDGTGNDVLKIRHFFVDRESTGLDNSCCNSCHRTQSRRHSDMGWSRHVKPQVSEHPVSMVPGWSGLFYNSYTVPIIFGTWMDLNGPWIRYRYRFEEGIPPGSTSVASFLRWNTSKQCSAVFQPAEMTGGYISPILDLLVDDDDDDDDDDGHDHDHDHDDYCLWPPMILLLHLWCWWVEPL